MLIHLTSSLSLVVQSICRWLNESRLASAGSHPGESRCFQSLQPARVKAMNGDKRARSVIKRLMRLLDCRILALGDPTGMRSRSLTLRLAHPLNRQTRAVVGAL